ncbi:MAG: hypothetical protein LIO62_09035 [Clostridiales bacterium]|nr:hypothetical protein [Clostridiales bacterium]
MLWTIISENDIFASGVSSNSSIRSSNPYDYIRNGFFIDNASLYGGKNYVNFNSNIPGNRSSLKFHITNI